jgi:hypothetical protein
LALAGLPQRGALIDMPIGQRVLQSVLLQCFAYPDRYHPWDPQGRRLPGLYDCYGSWVSPQPDRVVIGSLLARRLCGYLLPYVFRHADPPRCAGIPGLRLVGTRSRGYVLHHLPTDTRLEIHDRHRASLVALRQELRINRDNEHGHPEPVWDRDTLTDVERRWDAVWHPTAHTGLYSALFVAMPLFDGGFNGTSARHPSLTPAPHPHAHAVMAWCGTLAPSQVGDYLDALGVGDGTGRLSMTWHADNFATLSSPNGTIVELHRRSACATCSRTAFVPAHG